MHQDTPKTAYLRERPFLVVKIFTRPIKGVNTSRKGWMSDPRNTITDETPVVIERVSSKQLTEASIVIDLIGNIMVKNHTELSDEEALVIFTKKYSDIIEQGRNNWARRRLIDDHQRDRPISVHEVAN